ncbi:DUF3231 family protein [Bacillus weihaiensis]|uniref:Uncharacterized protein n=1 Tax=Bacillus weihaiensis TaxID=1547283 RepID=A0A1L3MRD1_9BACI|nr:DUF3231 family protein [Bacillus weihaiensis]APH04886.1 hypothetical protein A9C19_09065 [Bacillus weihaiensis]
MTSTSSSLSSIEMSQLWGSYINDSALLCQLSHFSVHTDDEKIKALLLKCCELSKGHLKTLKELFDKEQFAVPYGFKVNEDCYLTSSRLYTDSFYLTYILHMSRIALQTYSLSLSYSSRADIFSYFSECINETGELLRTVTALLMERGEYVKPPEIPVPTTKGYVEGQHSLSGFIGKKRSLTVIEISQLFANFERNQLGMKVMTSFLQVSKDPEVKKLMNRGIEIATKHCDILENKLIENHLPAPISSDVGITESTEPTFSEKLMTFYTSSLIGLSVGYYGQALGVSPRRDLGINYDRLIHELLLFSEDAAQLMIKKEWLEQPPIAPDRDKLIHE